MVQEMGIVRSSLLDFARWWKRRCQAIPEVRVESDRVVLHANQNNLDDLWVDVHTEKNEIIRRRLDSGRIEFSEGRIVAEEKPAVAVDVRRTREFDLRARLGNLYNSLLRKVR
jgi:hypothetical protein